MLTQLKSDITARARVICSLKDLQNEYQSIGRRGTPLDPVSRPHGTVVWEVPKADGFGFSKSEDYTNMWVAHNWEGVAHLGIQEGDVASLRMHVNAALDKYCKDVESMGHIVERVPHPEGINAINFVYIDNASGVYHTSTGRRIIFFAHFQHENRKPEEQIVFNYLDSKGYIGELPTIRSPWFDEINGNYFYADIPVRSDFKKTEGREYLKLNIQCYSEGPHARTSFESLQFTSAVLGTHILGLKLKSHKENKGETHHERLEHGGTYHGNIGMTFIGDTCYFIPDMFEDPEETTQMIDYLFDGKSVAITKEKYPEVYNEALQKLPLNCVYLGTQGDTPVIAMIKEAPLTIQFMESRGIKVLPQDGAALGCGGGGFYCCTTYRHDPLTEDEQRTFSIEGSQYHEPMAIEPYREVIYHGQ